MATPSHYTAATFAFNKHQQQHHFIPTLFGLRTKFIYNGFRYDILLFLDLPLATFLENITSNSGIQLTTTLGANHFMSRCILDVAKNKS